MGVAMLLPFAGMACFAHYMLAGLPPTIDWCERNYAVSGVIAEWWNSYSMGPWILSSAFGLHRTLQRRPAAPDAWVATAYALSTWIALGSLWFHATLTRFSQSMDELPMLFLGLHAATLFLRPERGRTVLVVGSLLLTLLYCCSDAYEQFLIPYAIATTASFVYVLVRIFQSNNRSHRTIGFTGVISMALAITVWAVEQHKCRDWLKLHACWHVGVGVATYTVIAFIAVEIGPGERMPIAAYFPSSRSGGGDDKKRI